MDQLTIGSLLGRTLAVFRQRLGTCLGLSLLTLLPVLAFTWATQDGTVERAMRFGWVVGLIYLIGIMLAIAAIAFAVFEALRGRHASVGRCLGIALRRAGGLLGLFFLMGLAFMGVMFAGGIVGAGIVGGLFGEGIVNVIATGLSVGALTLALWCRWFVSVPALIVERVGPVGALGRSAQLTSGYRWHILGAFVVLALCWFGLSWVVGKAVGEWPLAVQVANAAIQVGFNALAAVIVAVAYHDLRGAKEGVDAEALVAVFG